MKEDGFPIMHTWNLLGKMQKKEEFQVEKLKDFVYSVKNLTKGTEHIVDTARKECVGDPCRYNFTKKNKKGVKKPCKHIIIASNLSDSA